MDEESAQRIVRQMFDQTALRYVKYIDPAFKPLVEGLVEHATLAANERVLDLGTGTGLAALEAAPFVRHVLALDYSRPLLLEAQAKLGALDLDNVSFVRGDMHALGLANDSFDVVIGSFSFNSTTPVLVFPEAFRVLSPGGRLVMQEWGASDSLSEIAYDALAEYSVEDPPPPLATLRTAMGTPGAWDELEDIDDLTQAIEKAGFREVTVQVDTHVVTFPSIESFLNYKLAWSSRHQELKAMSEEMRELLRSEMHERLEPHAQKDGSLHWQPEVMRVKGVKPTK